MTSAEGTIALQNLEIKELMLSKSNSDSKITSLVNELEHSKTLLEKEKQVNAEAKASLKQQLTNLECQYDSQTEQCLKLEEELATTKKNMAVLLKQLDNEKKSNESQMNSLQHELETLEKSHADLEVKCEPQLEEMQTELSNAHERLKLFEQMSATLELQLKHEQVDLQHAKEVNQEVVVTKQVVGIGEDSSSKCSHAQALKVSLENLEKKYAHMSQLNEQLQKDKAELSATEQRLCSDVLELQNQLSAIEKELSDQSEVYMNEISRIKEDLEKEKELNSERTAMQLAEMHLSLMEQMDESAQEYELKLGNVKQELNDSKYREKILKDKLTESEVNNEKLVATIADLTESETKCQRQVADLEFTQSHHSTNISQLKADLEKYQEELAQAKMSEERACDTITCLQSELRRVTSEDVDFVPIIRSPNCLPYKSDLEAQGKLITQMKTRLEELQRLLLTSRPSEDAKVLTAELGLIQELLANNSALYSTTKQMRREFEAKHQEFSQFLARKDDELKHLQLDIQKALEALSRSNMQQLLDRMNTFSDYSNTSLDKYRARIEAGTSMLESISGSVYSQDQRHSSTLESVLSDLNWSQLEICRYKDEIERLRSQLEQSHHHDAEQESLITNELAVQSIATEASPPGSSKRRVDEGSGQLIDSSSEMDDAQTMESILKQKYNEISTLKGELDHAKRKERHARTTIDELEQDLHERNQELLQKADEVQEKEKEIKRLERKLCVVVNEAIGPVVKDDKQPLDESKSMDMSQTIEEDKLKIKKQQEQVDEVSNKTGNQGIHIMYVAFHPGVAGRAR